MKLKTAEPFWLVKNGIPHTYPSLRANVKADVVIVGGGITGSLVAHRCVEEGYNTIVVDRREIGHGSTSATTSMLQYEIDTSLHELSRMIGRGSAEASYQACFDSIDTIRGVSEMVRSQCGFQKKKSLYFAATKKDRVDLKQEFAARKAMSLPVEWIEAEQVRADYGLVTPCGGILSDQGGSIDAFCLAHDILHHHMGNGLRVYDKTNLVGVQQQKRGLKLMTDWGYSITCKKVIYCSGFESVEMIKESFVKLISTYAMVSEAYDSRLGKLDDTLFWNTADPYLYMRTTDDHRFLIGGGDEEFVNPQKRDALLNKKAAFLAKAQQNLLPEWDFRTDFVWAGTFGTTKDGLPYIGAHPDFPHAYFVLGFGGNGITFSTIGMDMVVSFLKNKRHPLTETFRFRR